MMRARSLGLLTFLFLTTVLPVRLPAGTFHIGAELGLGTSIGTGKGYWDWTDKSKETQRNPFVFNGGAALLFLADLGPVFQLETGIGYHINQCKIKNDGTSRIYRQDSLDIPLSLRMFFRRGERGLYVKGGVLLLILTDGASFKTDGGGDDLFASSSPKNRFHGGLQFGMGYQWDGKVGLWQIEGRYVNFYTSPDYKRADGTTADVRFHRMQLAFGWFY